MILNKVIFGFVIQQFDTDKRQFVGQEFIGSDDRHWETTDERELNLTEDGDAKLVYGEGGVDEPYLNMEMVQPATVENFRKALETPPLTTTAVPRA